MEYNPNTDTYWDESALAQDMKTAFDICNGCRLCFSLCPSFPDLFKSVEAHDDNVDLLTDEEMARPADLCYQCKLCYMKCPYIPPHRFDLDFPRLMLRSKAIRAKKNGMAPVDRFLGDPERIGRLGTAAPTLSNWSNQNPMMRQLMEKTIGIDHRRHLPKFAIMRFSTWALKRQKRLEDTDVAIFSTCTVEYHEPGIGQAAMNVLSHNDVRATVPSNQRCCGMPALDGGDIAGAIERAKQNVAIFAPYAKAGKKILALQPTCAYVLKQEYPLLLGTEDAKAVSEATIDVTEYLAQKARRKQLKKDFKHRLGTVTYHLSCHTKAEGLRRSAKDLLSYIDGTTVNVVDRCAGIDGTWGLKAEFYDESQKVAAKLTEAFREAKGTTACSDCALAGLQIETAADSAPRHPVELLQAAYGLAPVDSLESEDQS
ncbi:heterodisulfide reductase-related iron-sulfur binding cluster [Sulfobacillus thermosulfidooxidans]|uniref:heterodisulfide reductase-related iron-sulfur binding cluster n=1 Tax=Sulfobacillus thermosulfidooxidans TaxID=28034 RepID=UPI00096B7CFF|nr:heterodisulfide reductase-related iron-sulfur binding cluster [Sulfobacillus thermosulfidooxidans]OLZ10001.1 ferredoxin [Sulfobacillus thermosulfidooxidans]OLZ15694.1 ferredoxin [Sulfobacillus thermosulfidooxidans]OLZ18460.1 ferredoxin [Sulfobacillus thermosulfidooxidans]